MCALVLVDVFQGLPHLVCSSAGPSVNVLSWFKVVGDDRAGMCVVLGPISCASRITASVGARQQAVDVFGEAGSCHDKLDVLGPSGIIGSAYERLLESTDLAGEGRLDDNDRGRGRMAIWFVTRPIGVLRG